MRHRGRGVKLVGFIFLTPETHWPSVGKSSFLRLDNILILFSFYFNYFSNEIVISLSCVIS